MKFPYLLLIPIICISCSSNETKTVQETTQKANSVIVETSEVASNAKTLQQAIESEADKAVKSISVPKVSDSDDLFEDDIKQELTVLNFESVLELLKNVNKESYDKSINKGKSCEEVLDGFEQVVDQLIQNVNDENLGKLGLYSNDIVLSACRKFPAFETRYNLLNAKLKDGLK